jgi:hypothetical protein
MSDSASAYGLWILVVINFPGSLMKSWISLLAVGHANGLFCCRTFRVELEREIEGYPYVTA